MTAKASFMCRLTAADSRANFVLWCTLHGKHLALVLMFLYFVKKIDEQQA